jgi:hypothetical protein
VRHMLVAPPHTRSRTWFVLTSTTSPNLSGTLMVSLSVPKLRVMPNSNPSTGSGSGV